MAMIAKLLFAALAVGAFLTSQRVAASDLSEAYSAYINGDSATALQMIRPLAEKGDIEAQYVLGYMYESGHVAEQNSAEAANWFRRAADQGDPMSQIALGRLYQKGKGVEQNYAEAVSLYAKAAASGSARGHYRLASMYRFGLGVPEDFVLAHMHYNLAAAGFTVLPAVKARDEVAELMTSSQISEARRRAREWLSAHPPENLIDPEDKSDE